MQEFIIFITVGVAVLFIGRSYYRKFTNVKNGGCGSGCSCCKRTPECADPSPGQGFSRLP